MPEWEVVVDDAAVFVAHPFTKPFTPADLRPIIKDVLAAQGKRAVFADEQVTSQHILQKICGQIQTSLFGIYDISLWRPNVTLELGLAIGLFRPYLILLDKRHSDDLPSDIKGFDRIDYASLADLETQLAEKLPGFIADLSED